MQVTSLLSHHEHEHETRAAAATTTNIPSCISGRPSSASSSSSTPSSSTGFSKAAPRSPAPARSSARSSSVYPIVVTAIKDLRRGKLSINELVAIAVLFAFASGNYTTAGIVAFFMLTGEIIETRTAEGARDSIESLIKLTPTKARRILNRRQRRRNCRERTCRRRCHQHPSGRQCRGGRNHFERPGFVQSGHHHRRILARRQKNRRRSFRRHAKSHRRSGNQSQPRRNGHDARPRARIHYCR